MKRKNDNDFNSEALRSAADELNDLMFEEGQGIDIEGTDKEIIKGLEEAAAEIKPDDEITPETTATLVKLGFIEGAVEAAAEPEKPARRRKSAEAEAEKEPAKEVASDVPLEKQVENVRKLADLKALVEDNEELSKLRKGLKKYSGLAGTRDLRAAICKTLGIEVKKAAPAAKPKKEKGPKRTQILAKVLQNGPKGGLTRAEMAEAVQKEFGGTLRECDYYAMYGIDLLTALNLLEEKEGKFKFVG